MHVLRRLIREEGFALLGGAGQQRLQSIGHKRRLFVAQDARAAQPLAVRETPAHIRLEEPPVEAERAIETREPAVRLPRKAPAP